MSLSHFDTKDVRAELDRVVTARKLKGSYFEFFMEFWENVSSEKLVVNWHHVEICFAIQEMIERVIRRDPKAWDLLINIPPGMTKSILTSEMANAWAWTRDPTLQFITVSYDKNLALDQADKTRDIILSDNYQKYFGDVFQIKRGQNAKGFYRNTAGGYRLATSTGSNITGRHAHVIFVDDPLNPKAAASEVKKKEATDYLNKSLHTRKVDKANTPTALIMQRLAEDDPAGDWLDKMKAGKKKIKHLCFPATDDFDIFPESVREKYVRGLLDPIRLSREVLLEDKGIMGSTEYAGQYGQSPRAVEGNKIKYAWFEHVKAWDLPPGIIWDALLDGAYTKSSANDPTGLHIVGWHAPTQTLYLRHREHVRMELPELLRWLPKVCREYGLGAKSTLRVEPKASGKSIVQMLKADPEFQPSVMEIKTKLVQEGKEARCQTAAPRIESKQFVLVEAAWNQDYKDQMCTFPNAKHDEDIDLSGYSCEHYFSPPRRRGARRRN